MLFGVKLASGIYPPWKSFYIDYDKLKDSLKEDETKQKIKDKATKHKNSFKWTDKDEGVFVGLLDQELEKVYGFQVKTYNDVLETLNDLEEKNIIGDDETTDSEEKLYVSEFQKILEDCLTKAQELDNFSRLNYTGFIKIVKKHDKLHSNYPSVKALLNVRLKELPFHSEEYSPLLYKISFFYNLFRDNSGANIMTPSVQNSFKQAFSKSGSLSKSAKLNTIAALEESHYDTFKFWVHPDNLMEVKTRILRHLPVLVYASNASAENGDVNDFINQVPTSINDISLIDDSKKLSTISSNSSTSSDDAFGSLPELGPKLKEVIAKGKKSAEYFDPVITCIYFDNNELELYNNKLLKIGDYSSLRLRWIGRLVNKPEVVIEKKQFFNSTNAAHHSDQIQAKTDIASSSNNDDYIHTKLRIKPKFISSFINGQPDYEEKLLYKLERSNNRTSVLESTKKICEDLQTSIVDNHLEPVLRTMFIRTAFQIPDDDRIRITIDSDILFIREDSFDQDRPIRPPGSWHNQVLDSSASNPLKFLRQGEFNKFPYALMEIKVKSPSNSVGNKFSSPAFYPTKHSQWLSDLTNSHLVKEVPNFSKFVQGMAAFHSGDDEKVDALPYWFLDIESGIKIDPQQAYEEEQRKLAKQLETERRQSRIKRASMVGAIIEEEENNEDDKNLAKDNLLSSLKKNAELLKQQQQEEDESEDEFDVEEFVNVSRKKETNMLKILTNAKLNNVDSEDEEFELPAGVEKPKEYLKNAGPLKIEAKVWLANERTFNRWLHVCVLMSLLTFTIYNSAKSANFPVVAQYLAFGYFILTIASIGWAYRIYFYRLNVIEERSDKHLDAPLGPLILSICVGLTIIFNFVAAFKAASNINNPQPPVGNLTFTVMAVNNYAHPRFFAAELPEHLKPIQKFVFDLVNKI
ncbi:hypothetical protein QEN19_003927 [Hanseniaspora menglaensis]